MSLKCIFRFENLDSTRDLNQRSEYLFNKGIYYGGNVTIYNLNSNTIKISPFRLISHDGMHVLSDSNIFLSLNSGDYYVLCKAKYVVDDSPDVNVFLLNVDTYSGLSDEEKKNYVIFANVKSNGTIITELNIKDYREEVSNLGRNSNRGYFESEQALSEILAFEGDFATVKSENSSEILLYIYDGNSWISYPNSRMFDVRLTNHKNNRDVSIVNRINPSISDDKKNKGAYHINWNQLNSLSNFEYGDVEGDIFKKEHTQTFNHVSHLQIIPLDYKLNPSFSEFTFDTKGADYLTSVDNVNQVTAGKYYVDYENSLLYIHTINNDVITITTYTIKYFYSYRDEHVVADIEFEKIPRHNERKALVGNEYGIHYKRQAPSETNPFITANSPVPKKVVQNFYVELIDNEYYLVSRIGNYFIGDDDYKRYFEVIDLEEGLPINIGDVKVKVTSSSNVVSIRDVDKSTDCTNNNGNWFVSEDKKRIALKVEAIGTFTASSLVHSVYDLENTENTVIVEKKVYCHTDGGLGEVVSTDQLDYLTDKNYEKSLLIAKNATFGTLFSVSDNDNYELSISQGKLKAVSHSSLTKIELDDEIGFFYDATKVGLISSKHTLTKDYFNIESFEDLHLTGHKDIFITNDNFTNESSGEILNTSGDVELEHSNFSLKNNESLLETIANNDYTRLRTLVTNNNSLITLTSISTNGLSNSIISSGNGTEGPFIEVKNDENESLYDKSSIRLVLNRTVGTGYYQSSIIEKASTIEINNATSTAYSKYLSHYSKIVLENGEAETNDPNNSDTRKYSKIEIQNDSISINTIYGTESYSKYISEDDKITIENGEAETNDPNNSDTRKYSKIEIENNKISLNTIQGDVGNSIVDLEDNQITMYSSNLVISSVSNDANKYGIEIDNTANSNKGIMIVTSNPPNYIHLNDDFVKLSANDVSSITARENGISLEFIDSNNSSYLKSTYNTSGFKTEAYDSSNKADASLSKSLIYLSTYSSNFSIPDSSIELNRTLATMYVGNNSQFKVTDSYIESKVNTSYTKVSDSIESKVEDNDGSKTISLQRKTTSVSSSILNFTGTGIVLSHAVSSYSNAISLNDTLNLVSNKCVSINCSVSPTPYITDNSVSINSDNKILLTSGTYIGNATVIDIDKTRYTTNVSQQMTDPSDNTKSITVTSFIDINETNDAVPLKYTAIGISQTYQATTTESIKLLMSNNPNSEVEIDSVHQLYTSGKMTVTIGNNSYWVVLCKIPTA